MFVEGDLGHVELAVAGHAGPAGPDDVGAPGGVAHGAVGAGVDGDAAVDDGDQVAVGERVEYGSGLGPVHAGEDEVVVEREAQSLGFAHRQVRHLDPGMLGGGRGAGHTSCDVGLGAAQPGVSGRGADEPVEVVVFDDVEVHDSEVLQSRRGEPRRDVEADAVQDLQAAYVDPLQRSHHR